MFSYYTSILVLCWLALATMCILVHENNRIPLHDKRLLYVTYALVAVSALAEWCGVQLNGKADIPVWVLKLVKCADYILTPAAGGALVAQMRLQNRWQRAIEGILISNAAFQIVSIPGQWVLAVDEAHFYSHGPLFPAYLSICIAIILLIIAQFILYGRTFTRQNQVSLYMIMLLVVVGIAFQEMPGGYRTAYIGMTIAAALMFIHHTEYSQLAADEAMAEQRIQLMLSQIKPHFLYNALGSIEALCERDPRAAKLATRKFSKYLRGNMNSLTGESMIPFETELRHTELYLELEQVRFGDALRVEYDITARDFFLPPLSLEPIVENAVKHGVRMNTDGRGTVTISAAAHEDCYELRITDDGPGFDPEKVPADGTHVGIQNVRERLRRICDGTLVISPAPGRGTVATIRLPRNREV